MAWVQWKSLLVFQSMAEATRTELSEQLLIKWFRASLEDVLNAGTHQANADIIADTTCRQPWHNRGPGLQWGRAGLPGSLRPLEADSETVIIGQEWNLPAPGLSLLVWVSFQRVGGLHTWDTFVVVDMRACTHKHTLSLVCVPLECEVTQYCRVVGWLCYKSRTNLIIFLFWGCDCIQETSPLLEGFLYENKNEFLFLYLNSQNRWKDVSNSLFSPSFHSTRSPVMEPSWLRDSGAFFISWLDHAGLAETRNYFQQQQSFQTDQEIW